LAIEPAPRFPLERGFVIIDMLRHPNEREQRLLRADAFSGRSSLTEEEMQGQLRKSFMYEMAVG